MEKMLSLHKEIELFMKIKLSICKCNPCNCSEKRKDLYFKELKDILSKYNKDYVAHMLTQSGSNNNGEMIIQ